MLHLLIHLIALYKRIGGIVVLSLCRQRERVRHKAKSTSVYKRESWPGRTGTPTLLRYTSRLRFLTSGMQSLKKSHIWGSNVPACVVLCKHEESVLDESLH